MDEMVVGKRKQQKAERRARILKAATKLFARHGYQKTTVDAIAKEAGVAWATIYKYFKTKEEIVIEVIRPGLEKIFEQGERIIQNPPEDPAEAVSILLSCYMRWRKNWQDRRFQLELCTAGMLQDSGVLYDIANSSNEQIYSQIRDLLRALQSRQKISEGTNISDLSTVIMSVFNAKYIDYVSHESVSSEWTFAEIDRLTRSLFRNMNLQETTDA